MGGSGRQSLFAPFGVEARYQLSLTGWLVLAAVVILVGVLALSIAGIRRKGKPIAHQSGIRMIWWLGAVFPTVTLFALLVVTLPAMRPIVAGADALKIAVTGEQFWWRVGYAGPQGGVITANELRVPVGRTVDLRIEAGDVLHSFWVPGLAGKMDMIPGRTNRLVVRATKAGVYRGQCAEFCGLSHALMAFDVVAMEPAAFDAWLAREAAGAAAPADAAGAAAFARHGCGGCHAVRGTGANGMIGPDLTHIGARRSLGAGMQPMTLPNLARFVRDAPSVKPGVRMPAYPQMTPEEAQAIARYLKGLA